MKKFLASLLLMVFFLPLALQAIEVEGADSKFFYDFNDGSIAGWKTVDVDNDGYCWLISGEGYIYSQSSEYLKPNNVFSTTKKYAIYPTSKITFDARPLDSEKAVAKYGIGVAYSLDGVYFTPIQDETVLASTTDWNTIEVSLEYCANQEVYIGILHYTFDDQGTILVDNIKLSDGMLNKAKDVVAAENGNNVDLTWAWDDFDATQTPCGYRVYRAKEGGNTTVIADNVTETAYQDNKWSEQEWGIYQWGVAALYEQQTRGGVETLLEEGFETSEYPNLPEGWTKLSIPASSSYLGPWSTSAAITNVINPDSGEKFAFSYGSSDDAEFYMVTPALDLTKAVSPTLSFSYAAPGVFENPGNTLRIKYSESLEGPWSELWSEQSNFMWKQTSVNISACSGKNVYLAFVNEDHKNTGNFGVAIDDVVVKAQISEGSVPVASRIAWSNPLEKDMFTTLTVKITANDNSSVEGTNVIFWNIENNSYRYKATLDATGTHEFNVRRGPYAFSITLEGYESLCTEESISVYEAQTFECELEKLPDLIEGLYVSPTGWAMWDYENANVAFDVYFMGELVEANTSDRYYQHDVTSLVEGCRYTTTIYPKDQNVMLEYYWTYSSCRDFANAVNFRVNKEESNAILTWDMPTYEAEPEPIYEFSVNFDNGSLEGWTSIDGDGDGYIWRNTAEFAYEFQGFGVNNTYCAASLSYETELGKALNPNNFLVSGSKCSIVEGSKLTYSIAAQSKDAPAEHYGIAISTKSNNNINDFTVIFDETLEAGEVEEHSTQGQWFERTVDLSAYAGQTVYIAFRHYDSRDNSWIKVDNISLAAPTTRGNREGGEWLYYDNGFCELASGNFDASTMQTTQIYWAIMFPADLMVDYAKRTISKVALYDYSAHKGAFSIHTGGDDAPGTMVYVQSYETTGKKSYIELELDTPVTISGKENIWIQFSNEYGSGSYVAAYSADMGDPNSRWRSDNGSLWFDANWYGEGWYGTWMIRAFVDEKDESIIDDPESTTFETLGTLVYRNGELITPTPIKENTFTDTFSADEDQVEYSIRVVYGGKKDISYYAMSCPLTKTFLTKDPMVCPAPQKLYGEPTLNQDGTFGATLVWPYAKEWLRYDDGDVVEDACVGTGNPMQWAIMFPAKDIEQYIGASITEIGLFDVEACDATLVIAYGNDFAPNQDFVIHQQDFSFTGSFDYLNIKTTAPVQIIDEGNLWIIIKNLNGKYPAAVTKNTGNPNGRWCSFDGNTWNDLYAASNYKLDFSWYLRAYVSNEPNRGDNGVLDHYNIYRSESNSNYELIATTKDQRYFDETERGTYYYQVTSVYKRGEETCESEPAKSFSNSEEDYVVIEVTKIDENGVKGMIVYPNPAKDMLNITAENMRRITISNVLGQVVYDQNVNSDNEIINMSQYEAGIYMVRIATENGIAVKRISVTK